MGQGTNPRRRFTPASRGSRPYRGDETRETARHGKWTAHHCIPRSRGGRTEPNNKVWIREKPHQAFHYLFGNLRPEEIIGLLASQLAPSGYFTFLIMVHHDPQTGERIQIRLDQDDLAELQFEPMMRLRVPNFRDHRTSRHVRLLPAPKPKRRTR